MIKLQNVGKNYMKYYNISWEVIRMWFLFALLSAVFAALTSILAKVGIEFQSGYGCQNGGCCDYGMGDGFCDGR